MASQSTDKIFSRSLSIPSLNTGVSRDGAVVPPSKNLYYFMKNRLDSHNSSNQKDTKAETMHLKTMYKESDYQTQQFKQSLSSSNFFSQSKDVTQDSMKTTLSGKPVTFGKRMYLQSLTPSCAQSSIPLPGLRITNDFDFTQKDQQILMPRKRRLSPLKAS